VNTGKQHVSGAYGELANLLLELADLFIFNETLKEVTHFNGGKYQFHFACGADGMPFRKDDKAMAWVISFISGTVKKKISFWEEPTALKITLAHKGCKQTDSGILVQLGKQNIFSQG